jgi:hypothetical protein
MTDFAADRVFASYFDELVLAAATVSTTLQTN